MKSPFFDQVTVAKRTFLLPEILSVLWQRSARQRLIDGAF